MQAQAQAQVQVDAQQEVQAAAQAGRAAAAKKAEAAAVPSMPCESPAAPRDEERLPPAKRSRSELGSGGDGCAAQGGVTEGGAAEGGGGRAGAVETAARPPKTKATETRAKARRPTEAGQVACAFDPKTLQTVDTPPAALRHASSSGASCLQPEPATKQTQPAGSQRTRRSAGTASADAGAGTDAGTDAGGAAAATEETPEVPQVPTWKRQRGSLSLTLAKNKNSPAQAKHRQAAAVQSAPVREAMGASPSVSAIVPASSTALSAVAADATLGTPALRREAEAPLAKSDEALSLEFQGVIGPVLAEFSQRQLASGVTQRQLDRVLQSWHSHREAPLFFAH